MKFALRGTLAALLLTVAGVGCQNKVVSERDELYRQNQELQQQLDEANRARAAQAVQPAIAPAPAMQASASAPLVEPASTPAPAPKAVRPDLGNLEVTHDAVAGTTTVNLPSDVFFGPGKAELLPEAKKSLSKVISALKKEYASKPVKVQGNTDSDPIVKSHWKSNQELSERRADAVRDYLVSKGIDADRITTEGFGDTKPKSKSDKAKNRRVELVVLTR